MRLLLLLPLLLLLLVGLRRCSECCLMLSGPRELMRGARTCAWWLGCGAAVEHSFTGGRFMPDDCVPGDCKRHATRSAEFQ
jgi:hypothetical protein